ncbi:MAG: glycosyltransferase family 4 protein [Oscillibacter sp.]|nr:glycosyltransferase family 4 protein [Oscillibacter sp.]
MDILPIVFDNIVFSLQKSGGISVVWYEFLNRYLKEYSAYARFIDYGALDNIFRKQLALPPHKIILSNASFLKLKRYLPVHIKSVLTESFIFHSSYYRICSNKNAVNITTVHDFTYEYFRKGLSRSVHCWQKYNAIRHSDYIICISENTKKDLLKFVPDTDENKIFVIYNGVSEEYFPFSEINENELPFPAYSYLIFVGGRSLYKNFKFAVKTIAHSNFNLVIVGDPLLPEEVTFLKSYLPDNRYICLGRVNNHRLNILYNRAFCLFYPSSYEGFGIPVIEAQKAGCPVIAYAASSIPEIIGNKQLLLPHLDLSLAVEYLNNLKEHSLRHQIVTDGLQNAHKFSWDNTYQETLKVYALAQHIK